MRRKKYSRKYKDLKSLVDDIYLIENNEPTFTLTLSTGTAATVISNQFVGTGSVIAMMPTSADAGTEPYSITTTAESFTITHSSGS